MAYSFSRHAASANCTDSIGTLGQVRRAVPVHRSRNVRCQGWKDWMKDFLDPTTWAPKSTRIWRLQQYEYPSSKPDEVDELEARINQLPRKGLDLPADDDKPSSSGGAPSSTLPASSAQPSSASRQSSSTGDLPLTGSFSEAGDDDLARALQSRIQTLSASSLDEEEVAVEEEEVQEEEVVPELTGREMRELILAKYGKTYDCSFVRRDIPGKTFVCLNIMWQHLEQRSFRLTEEQYEEKISSIAYLINVLGQTKKVRSFLQAPARSSKGLPRRPVVGTAISIQLDLPPELIQEFFGAGYQ